MGEPQKSVCSKDCLSGESSLTYCQDFLEHVAFKPLMEQEVQKPDHFASVGRILTGRFQSHILSLLLPFTCLYRCYRCSLKNVSNTRFSLSLQHIPYSVLNVHAATEILFLENIFLIYENNTHIHWLCRQISEERKTMGKNEKQNSISYC